MLKNSSPPLRALQTGIITLGFVGVKAGISIFTIQHFCDIFSLQSIILKRMLQAIAVTTTAFMMLWSRVYRVWQQSDPHHPQPRTPKAHSGCGYYAMKGLMLFNTFSITVFTSYITAQQFLSEKLLKYDWVHYSVYGYLYFSEVMSFLAFAYKVAVNNLYEAGRLFFGPHKPATDLEDQPALLVSTSANTYNKKALHKAVAFCFLSAIAKVIFFNFICYASAIIYPGLKDLNEDWHHGVALFIAGSFAPLIALADMGQAYRFLQKHYAQKPTNLYPGSNSQSMNLTLKLVNALYLLVQTCMNLTSSMSVLTRFGLEAFYPKLLLSAIFTVSAVFAEFTFTCQEANKNFKGDDSATWEQYLADSSEEDEVEGVDVHLTPLPAKRH